MGTMRATFQASEGRLNSRSDALASGSAVTVACRVVGQVAIGGPVQADCGVQRRLSATGARPSATTEGPRKPP